MTFPPPQASAQDQPKGKPRWLILAIVGVVVVGGVAANKSKKDDQPTASDKRLEAMRVTWNGLTAQQQFDICASVDSQGADVAADQIQAAAGDFGAATHDDFVFFLGDVACK